MQGQAEIKILPKGTILLAPGQKLPGIFQLHSGKIRQFLISSKGIELTLHIFTQNTFFPAISMFETYNSRYYYEAMSPSIVSIISPKDLENHLKNNPKEMFFFLKRILKGLEGLSRRVETETFGSSYVKTISILIYLAKHFGKKIKNRVIINHKFTHQQLATIVGASRERTSIELERLQRENLIRYKSSLITINDIKKLEIIISHHF